MKEHKSECVFCKDIDTSFKRKRPQWIADLQVSTAILCTNQICRGYTILIYNKAHITELFQLEREDRIAYSEDLVNVAKAIYDAYHPHKMNYELLGNILPQPALAYYSSSEDRSNRATLAHLGQGLC